MKDSIRGRLGLFALLLLALGTLSGAFWASRQRIDALQAAEGSTTAAYERVVQLERLLGAVRAVQAGSRGYVITGDRNFLEPFGAGIDTANVALAALDSLYGGDAFGLAELGELRGLVNRQQRQMARTVELRREGGEELAERRVSTGEGKAITDSLRLLAGTLIARERSRVTAERLTMAAEARQTQRLVLLQGLAAIGIFAFTFAALLRENRRRRVAADEVAKLNEALATKVERVQGDLSESERRLRAALDALLEGCAILDRDLRYLYVNAASARQGRLSPEQMIGRRMRDVYPGFEQTALHAAMAKVLRENRPDDVELEFVFPDGSSGWFALHLSPVPEGLFALSVENTERIQAGRRLRQSEARYRALVAGLPEIILLVEADGTVRDAFWPEHASIERPVDAGGGQRLDTVLGASAAVALQGAVEAALLGADTRTVQFEARAANGTRSFEAIVVPTDVAHVTVVARDVTERQALEQQLRQAQKMEAIGQLTGGIAHDFNNVLTIISTNAEMLAIEAVGGDADRQEVNEIVLAAKRGATMVAQLLSFSRRGMVRREPKVVRTVIAEFGSMLGRLLPSHVSLEIGPLASDDIVLLDSGALEQMLANLCTNARDAMPDGGTIRVACESTVLDAGYHSTHPWVTPGPYVVVSVADTGVGMDAETRARVFEPFFTTKAAGIGTGLGMAMVYGMMKDHEGMVHLYSEIGRGTIVKLYFPIATAHDRERPARRPSNPMAVIGGGEVLLLVEDDAAIRLATRRALASKGYEVLVAGDGEEALAVFAARKDDIALVISDMVMPNLGGRQLAEALRESGSRVPVMFMSGYSKENVYREGELSEGISFLHKPWTLEQLFQSVRDVLDGRTSA